MKTSNRAMTEKSAGTDRIHHVRSENRNWFGMKKKTCTVDRFKHRCLLEELERREMLSADTCAIDVGLVYVEQEANLEAAGDKFYIAWVGGETGNDQNTQLTQVTISLDKNQNGTIDEGEAYFDTEAAPPGTAAHSAFAVDKTLSTAELRSATVENGGQTLVLEFANFKSTDIFVFTIDVDEYLDEETSPTSAIVEGAEFGGNKTLANPSLGAHATCVFSESTQFYGTTWNGEFLDDYDGQFFGEASSRQDILKSTFSRTQLPYDEDADMYGINSAGVYGTVNLEVKPISVSGHVYADYDVDCNYDLGEDMPLNGVTVTLVSADGTYTATTTTDENGYYEFTNLSHREYDIYCQTDVPAADGAVYYDFCAKGGDYAEKITPIHINVHDEIPGGSSSENNNFSKVLPGSINGYVFEDRNDADNKNDGEPGIEGIVVELFKLDKTTNEYVKVAQTTTDADGYYEFDIAGQYSTINPDVRMNVRQTYLVREGAVVNYTDGKDYLGTFDGVVRGDDSVNDEFQTIFVGFDEHGVNYNFGELKLGSISGNVFEDRNDNGNMDDGEDGIANVRVDLYQYDGSEYVFVRSTTADENGFYKFDNLSICINYAVKEYQPDGYTDGKDHLGSLGGVLGDDRMDGILVTWDAHGTRYDFGELKLGSIAGNVFEDRNDNGNMDDGEAGIAGVTVDLYRWENNDYVYYKSTTTASDGSYKFDSLPINGEYAVKEHQPTDYTDGKDHVGSLGGVLANDYITDVEINWDEHGTSYDFGELKLGYLSGYVYEDDNDNGVKESGEAGIPGATVELYRLVDGEYVKQSETTTDSAGFYKFTNLSINEKYAIREIQPDGYDDGKDAVGTIAGTVVGTLVESNYMNDIAVGWNDRGINYNFGELKPIVPGSISGYVYYDAENDGIFDVTGDDLPIPGVTITLWVMDETSSYVETGRTAITDNDGYYIFANLDPGKYYRVTETQPTEYDDGITSVGTLLGKMRNNDLYDIYVGNAQHGEYYNFGEIKKPDVPDDPPEDHDYNWTPPTRSVSVPERYVNGAANPYYYHFDSPSPSPGTVSFFGGGGLPASYSWHLSVLDGGYPRSIEAFDSVAGFRSVQGMDSYMNVSWSGEALNRGEWLIRSNDGTVSGRYLFGFDNGIPVVGDWNGDGIDSFGLFVEGQWFLDRNGDGVWDREDLWAELGSKKDQPVVGDWDGDGKADIGVFGPQWAGDPVAIAEEPGLPADSNSFVNVSRPKNVPPTYDGLTLGTRSMKHRNNGKIRLDLVDHVFEYGNEGDRAISGDWNGDGVAKIGVYRNGEFYLDVNGNGKWDENDVLVSDFGGDKDAIPVIGDFNGDGIDNIGVFSNGKWQLDTNGDYKPDTYFTFGEAGDKPIAGDFNGDGHVQFGVYRAHSGATPDAATGAQNAPSGTVNAGVARAAATPAR